MEIINESYLSQLSLRGVSAPVSSGVPRTPWVSKRANREPALVLLVLETEPRGVGTLE